MNKEEAKNLYEGKYFYEIISREEKKLMLAGPFDNIYYATRVGSSELNRIRCEEEGRPVLPSDEYEFVQVVEGKVVQAFLESEILVTTQLL